jgi:hypothetical protein
MTRFWTQDSERRNRRKDDNGPAQKESAVRWPNKIVPDTNMNDTCNRTEWKDERMFISTSLLSFKGTVV